jgi:sterol desaturase/sphingolipid hydroxylase (fatty acid hydroxylase superfamily)
MHNPPVEGGCFDPRGTPGRSHLTLPAGASHATRRAALYSGRASAEHAWHARVIPAVMLSASAPGEDGYDARPCSLNRGRAVFERALPYVWYPLVTAAGIAAFALMLGSGAPLPLAAYLPVIAVGAAIVLLEWRFPEHRSWRPRWADLRADAAFMAVVQIALPRLLAAGAALALAAWMHQRAPSGWWPHHWPLAAQAIVMVLAVDFVRYWIHRACHHYPALWRLHEVHHSPDLLYVLNVGRFHPAEKALHFCADTLPFVALGVAPELIACYFLLYSVNGLFQHSNVRLRYGWLNYVVGSAETHRWHHARDPKVAFCNFGNTTIVWDLLFGTWHLPRDSRVLDVGIPDRRYPTGFWAQMAAPFRRRASRPHDLRAMLANAAVRLRLRLTLLTHGRRLAALTKDPMARQRALLARILRENAGTVYGRRHGFADIRCVDDYRARVPVNDYEALRPYIEDQIAQGEPALTAEPPVLYARTSGTTGQPKDVPLTRSHLAQLERIHAIAVARQHRMCPEAFEGAILAVVSPAVEGRLANGVPFGSASGMVAGSTPRLVREKFVIPPAVLGIADSRLKYLTILRLALARADITYAGAANPTTLLTLMKLYREHQSRLVRDVRYGSFFCASTLDPGVQEALAGRLRPDPARAAMLESLLRKGRALRMHDLWPDLRLVVTWTCASAGVAVDALRHEIGPRTRVLELGYLASEFRGSITFGRRAGSGMPTFDTHFFEFVERDRWERGEPLYLALDELRKGADYYLVVTTPSGLYRYFINDLVRVTGFLHRTPLIRFLQKGRGVTSITGEKLYEAQVLDALRSVLTEVRGEARFVMMLADEAACRYRLYIEPGAFPRVGACEVGRRIDARLRTLNIEYDAKRESGRLEALSTRWLAPGTGDAYKQDCVSRGQREGQFKTVALAYCRDFPFDLDARVEALHA